METKIVRITLDKGLASKDYCPRQIFALATVYN